MRPDAATTQAFLYCLGVAAERFNIGIVGFIANSNHWHAIVIDHDGVLPAFTHFFHVLFAKHQNCLRGRFENFWSSEQTSVVYLVDEQDVWDKLGYVLCNPVKDNLVAEIRHWPGASATALVRHGGAITIARPRHFFRRESDLPTSVTLRLTRAPSCEGIPDEQYRDRIEQLVTDRESAAEDDRRAKGVKVLGRRAVLRQHWDARPQSHEPRFQLSPRIACRNKWARIERLAQDRVWLGEYRKSRLRWIGGDPNVVFPAGTYNLRRFAGVKCVDWASCSDPGS